MDVYHQRQMLFSCYFCQSLALGFIYTSTDSTPHPALMITVFLQASLGSIQIRINQNKVECDIKQD